MRFETSQSMKLGQHMKLAPRMIQSMEILQMPLAELQERIERELESNIALEITEVQARPEDRPTRDQPQEDGEFRRLADYQQEHPDAADNMFDGWSEGRSRASSRLAGEPDAKMEAMANAPARAVPLSDQLQAQWSLVEVDERLRPIGRLIIEKLDEDGYLRTPLDRLIDEAPAPLRPLALDDVEESLSAIQLFLDPPGVAARDARECLMLQLDALSAADEPDDGARAEAIRIARVLVDEYLEDLTQNRLPRIADRAGITVDDIKRGLEVLRRLSLAPARRLVATPPTPIVPDAIVEYDENHDRYFAYLTDPRWQNLQVNREYALMARDRSLEKRDREFIRTNITNATWLIDAVQQRKRTLLRVVEKVIEHQRDYFDFGPEALRPLPMTQIAEELGVHVATVSRAVADKYIQTPRGIVPLRGFFSGGLQTESGEDLSYEAVRAALKEVVDAEDKAKPLSDEALADQLKARGIEIARRTIAKYRDQLGIPAARLRRQY
ncbi:MAG: RNA polymerase factor sigma-54 [Phycisphaeraceae bacterium]|nr:RNA polymerase factor sigma-54 [Phycisphaeraceae bacterium]